MTGPTFGDADPEDSWDPDDPVEELVENLRRRIVAIIALRAVDAVIEARLRWMLDDFDHVVGRLRAGLVDRVDH